VAFAAYRLAGEQPAATEGVERTREAAVQTTLSSFHSALDRSRFDLAEGYVARLASWAPEGDTTLRAALDLARARKDPDAELSALRGWARRDPTVSNYKRLAHLEVEFGDSERGLELFTQMSEQFPTDPEVADGLAAAQFVWRLEMLPSEVSEITTRDVLTRGDFAELLYWLVPGVRSGRSDSGQIVTDLPLEHPQRSAIVRVVNLGLLPMRNATLRQFAADEPLSRRSAYAALLALPEHFGTQAECTAELRNDPQPSNQSLCECAARCRLIEEPDACLPSSSLSGRDAREGLRRMLVLLEEQVR
jgi:hypothetical protein